MGSLGRVTRGSCQSVILMVLLRQSVSRIMKLRGVAYGQVMGIARAMGLSSAELLRVHAKYLYPLILRETPTHNQIVHEICESFLDTQVQDFFAESLPLVIPSVILNAQSMILYYISNETNTPQSTIVWSQLPKVLSEILMIPDEKHDVFERAITFLLTEVFENKSIEELMRPHAGDVLFEVFSHMARDDCHDTAAKALWALVAADSSIGAGDSRDPKYLAEFVAKDFLMIIDKITGELFDTDDIIVQRKTLRTLQALLKTVKPRLAQFTPKVLSVLKSALNLLAVRGEVLETWLLFLRFLDGSTIGPFLSQIVVTLLSLEEIESDIPEPDPKRDKVRDILQFLLVERQGDLKEFFCEIPIVSGKRYKDLFAKVEEVVGRRTLEDRLCQLIDSLSHESPQVRQMGLEELRFTLRDNRQMIYVCLLEQRTHSVSVLHTRISQLVRALLELCSDLDEEHDELAIATA
eukprot:477134_1